MGILEDIIQKDIDRDPVHFGTFTDEDVERFKKEYGKKKRKSLFE